MKILALDQGQHIGGAEIFFSDMLGRVSNLADIHLLTGKNTEYLNRYKNTQVTIHHADLPPLRLWSFNSLYSFFRNRRQLQRFIQTLKPDLIVSNTVRTHLFVSSIAKKNNIPLVWMVNDCTFPSWLLYFFLRYPKTIISCSRYVQEYYQSRFFRKHDIHWEILYPFGIDVELLLKLEETKKQKSIGMVGKFIPWKGHDVFINIAKRIHQNFPDYRFAIIGSVYQGNSESEQFFSACRNMIHDLGLSSVFRIETDITDVLPKLATWEILIHCSKTPEPLGRVILEGMAAGCSVIGSSLGGPSEIIEHMKTGLLVPSEMELLTQAVTQLLRDDALRNQLQRNAIKNIHEHFLWDNVVKRFASLLSIPGAL